MAFQRPFLIILKRDEVSQPWGFRVSGGADLAAPPRVEKVAEGSPAAQQGMHEGDLIIQVGKHNVQDLSEVRINALLAQPAKRLEVFIVREDFLQKPRKGEPSTVKAVVHNQYNSPLQLYSQEKVAETLAYHAQAITAEDGVNNIQPVGLPQNLVRSAVLQALSEDETGANPYRTANGTTVVQRATAPPPPPPKPRPPSYSSESPHTERPHSSSGHHVTFATPSTPGTPPTYQPNFYVPPPPAPPQHYEQPSYQQQSYQQPSYQQPGQQLPSYQQSASYPVQHVRQGSYEEADRRQQLIQAAELRQRQYEEERQQQAQYEEGRFRQPPQDFRRVEYEAEQRRIREEEERRRRLFEDEESIRQRQLQQEEQRRRLQQEEQQRQRRIELEEQERRRRQEQQEYEQYQRHQQQYQRYLEEQKRRDEELRRTEQQQQPQEVARRKQLEGQQRQAQPQRFQNAQREPLDVQRAQQEAQQRRFQQPTSAVASSPQHQEQVGSQAQRWENRIWEEQQARMPGTPLGSPSVSRRARDNVWPPKESSVRWTPKTGFSPQLTRQSSQGAKQFVWPPPKCGMANGDDGGFPSRPPSRTAVNAWHPGSPTSGTRTPPFARSPSLGRRTRDIAWPPPQPESSPKFVPRPVSRTGLHRPDEFVHQNASCGVPATYRPPPNSSQFL